MVDLARMRNNYETKGLDLGDVLADPVAQFEAWLAEAVAAELSEPNAMVVSSVDTKGQPRARHLLLKGISSGGFEFYTNYTSDKAVHLEANPLVSLTFGWLGLHRQVCITGRADKLSDAESDAYFEVRPRGSQLGAWASDQSSVVADRSVIEEGWAAAEQRFADAVPRPPHWGGYRVMPSSIEFWQGRPSRLHDRLRYERAADGIVDPGAPWTLQRLAP